MKYFSLIALGTLIFLSSEGWAGKTKRSPDNEDHKPHVAQTTQDLNFLNDLIRRGRPGGSSPHGDHLGDLLNLNPSTPSGDRPLLFTRGMTFYIPNTAFDIPNTSANDDSENDDSDIETQSLGSQD